MKAPLLNISAVLLLARATPVFANDNGSWNKHSLSSGRNFYGSACSMSEGLLVVGAPYDSNGGKVEDSGSVEILLRNGKSLDVTNKFTGDEFDELGVSVAVSRGLAASGKKLDVVVMGSDRHSTKNGKMNIGMAKVFYFSGFNEEWRQMGQDIVGKWAGEFFAQNVAVSDDGLVIALATSIGGESRRGRVEMYHFDDITENWDLMGFPIKGQQDGDKFGFSVSIAQVDTDKYAPENYYVAIGAPQASTNGRGIVQVYNWGGDEANWIQVGRDIEGDSELDQLGYDVSMAKNGSHLYLAIGVAALDYEEASDGGRVQVFKYNTDLDNTEWLYFGDEIEQYADGDGTGQVVELSQDGMILAIGAPDHKDGIGMVRIFDWDWDYGDYIRAGHYLEGKPDDAFGSCISISGNEVAIGAPYGGYVQVFTYDPEGGNALGSSKAKSGRSGFSKFITVSIILVVVAFLGLTVYKKLKSKGFKWSSFTAALPVVSAIRRHGREAVSTEDKRDDWPFPFFSPSDRARIDEVRKAEEGRADDDVDSVVLHGMPKSSSQDAESSSGSDESDDDVSYDSLGKKVRQIT